MNTNIDEIEKYYIKIQQLKNDMNNLNDLINKVYETFGKYKNEFKSHLLFNSTIFGYYQQNKVNYYILNNLRNLDFTSEIEYLNSINKNDKIRLIETIMNSFKNKKTLNNNFNQNQIKELNIENKLSKLILKNKTLSNENNKLLEDYEILKVKYLNIKNASKNNKNEKNIINKESNMWISEKYCKNWGLREAIREFIQNQYDGIITEVGTKKNLNIKKVGKKYYLNGKERYLDFLKKMI